VASFSGWLRRLLGLGAEDDAHALTARGGDGASDEQFALVVSESSAALATMYQDVLRKAGIPVLAREWGGGRALVGGVPMGMSLYVPAARADEAKRLLGVESGEDNVDDEGGQALEG
jgi:hypothetical protein